MRNRSEIPSNGLGLNSRDLREIGHSIELWIADLTPDELRLLAWFFEGLSKEDIRNRSRLSERHIEEVTLEIIRKANSFGIKLIQEST